MFDNLVVGKFRGPDGEMRNFAKELSLEERRAIDANPHILAEPSSLLARLDSLQNSLAEVGTEATLSRGAGRLVSSRSWGIARDVRVRRR
jgi:hypothetical protein